MMGQYITNAYELYVLKRNIIKEKDFCNIDNNFFVDSFTTFLSDLGTDEVINRIETAFKRSGIAKEFNDEINSILTALRIYTYSFDETIGLEILKNIK